MNSQTRRDFLKTTLAAPAALAATPLFAAENAEIKHVPGSKMRLGLCTYLWGQNWDLPTLIANCKKAGYSGIELRVDHAHNVSAKLTPAERKAVKKQFADAEMTFVGMGCNWDFHYTDPAKVTANIEGAKADVILSYECGGSGVKVKPNALPKEVTVEKTCRQIADACNVLGKFAAKYKQEIRVEVHGTGTSELPIMKMIFDNVTEPNVGICWNCNSEDLKGAGLISNFKLVNKRFANTLHVRELTLSDYPYQQLFDLLVAMDYKGWVLLEARTKPKDRIATMIEQRQAFEQMIKNAQAKL